MFENFWLSLKTFCTNHAQHECLEIILMILSIIFGAVAIIFVIMWLIRLNKSIKEMNKTIKKTKKISDKKILTLLKKKKNVTY